MSEHLKVSNPPSGESTVNRPKPSDLGTGGAAKAGRELTPMTRKQRIEKALRDSGA